MTAPDRAMLAELLAGERRRVLERLAAGEAELEGIVAASEGANSDDEHDPEGATIGYERARVTSLRAQAQADLAEVDAALQRLASGTISLCERCGSEIPSERLGALPTARTCMRCARATRAGGLRRGGPGRRS